MLAKNLVRTLNHRLGREHPLIPLWIITTLFAAFSSGTLGALFYTFSCGRGDCYRDAEPSLIGSLVAGGTLPLLLLIGHYILLRPARQAWNSLLLALPIGFLTVSIVFFTIGVSSAPFFFLHPIGLLLLGGLLGFSWSAGALAGTSYLLAKGTGPLSPILQKSGNAWMVGFAMFAIVSSLGGGRPFWLSVGWILCWAIVGWRSSGILPLVSRAAATSHAAPSPHESHSVHSLYDIPTQKPIEVGCLLLDREGRPLLVKPVDQAQWRLPGGLVHGSESPLEGCVRTVRQTMQLDVSPGRLLAVEYDRPVPKQAEQLYFLFDGGFLSVHDTSRIRLRRDMLSIYQFVAPADLHHYVSESVGQRILQAIDAHQMKRTMYVER